LSTIPSVWLLLDERPGHRVQALGVAERLGWPCHIKELHYNRLAALANVVLGRRMWHLTPQSRAEMKAPWPDLVISSGRRSAPVALAIKRRSRGKTKAVHLMWPDIAPARFDLIAVPQHDMPGHKGANILSTLACAHGFTLSRLQREVKYWRKTVEHLPHPRIAVLVGGTARGAEYEDADFTALAAYASAEAERLNGSLMIASSPRTGERGEERIQSMLTAPHLFYRWGKGENPYGGFLALADVVIVTGDSVSMCSEACATGKPVYIFMPPHLSKSNQEFRQALFAGAHAKPHTYPIRPDWQPVHLPDAAEEIARAIKTRLFNTA